MTVHGEVEATYEAALDLDLLSVLTKALDGTPGLTLTAEPEQRSLDATYFDTGDLHLAGVGITLRRRTGGADAGWHLKIPHGPDEKVEKHLSLAAARHRVPAQLRRLVQAHTRGAELAPVARIRTERTAYAITGPDEAPVAEVADDRVEATRLGERHDVQAALVWREVEIELAEGGAVSLADLDRSVSDHGLVEATGAARSKVIRVLGDAVPRRPSFEISRSATAAEVVQAHLVQQVEQLRSCDPLVRLDRPDSVHKMRVVTRRLRCALATFASMLPRDRAAGLRDELAWLAAHLGPARDTEVMRARLEHIARTEGSQGQAARWARARARALGQEYRTHHRDAVRAMDTERYDALLRDLLEVATELTQTAIGGQPAGQELPGHVSRAYRALKHSIDAIERSAAAEADRSIRDERLHEARKKAKRARYAAEALVPAFGEPALELARAIEQVQADLGEHQDTVVLREWLRGEAQGAGAAEAFALGRWYAGEEQRGQLAEERFAHSWQVARKKKLRRWLR